MIVHHNPSLTVGEALDQHLQRAGFTKDTYGPLIPIKLGPIHFRAPNPEWRQRSLLFHDLHHVLTEYDTSFVGEAQVSAWEARTGIHLPPIGFVIIYSVMILGWFVEPRSVSRAWTRGAGARNLFASGFGDELLQMNLGDLRRKLGIDTNEVSSAV